MESIIFIIVVFLIIIAVVPFILLGRINSLSNKIFYLDSYIQSINNRIREILNQSAEKKDIQEILNAIQRLEEKTHARQFSEPVQPVEKPVENIVPQEKEIVVEEQPVVVETPVIEEEEAVEEFTAHEKTEEISPVTIEIEEKVEAEEKAPAYAAFSNVSNTRPQTTFSEMFQQPEVSNQTQTRFEQPEPEKGFIEKIFGENLLAKIGIVTLVLGIAFFVKYAIDQDWINEIGRVAIGLLTGGIIIGIAHKLKEKYKVFSSILVGGGISVLYITVTLAFREYELFSQPIAFGLLIAITIFSVILSLFYDRKELAIFSLLGGFASPLMISTGSGNYIVLFSYILILNTGMLMVAFRRKWNVIGIISYVLTILFFATWLISSFENQFKGGIIFASLFFIQFYILALLDHFKGEHKVTVYQGILILTNNFLFFFACLTIFSDYPFDVDGLITIIIAAVNAVIMITLFRRSEVDRNLIYLIIGVVMTFVNLAIPIQMNGHVITMFWAVEMAVLLWLWQRSQIQIFRIGFIIVAALVIFSYLMDIANNYILHETPMNIVFNPICITGLVVIGGFFASKFLLSKEDKESVFQIGKTGFFNVRTCSRAIGFLLIAFTYLVPYLELNYQVESRLEIEYGTSLRHMIMTAYTAVYMSILSFLYRKDIATRGLIFALLSVFVVIYTCVYWLHITDLRLSIYGYETYSKAYFLVHFIALIPLALVIATLIRNVKTAAPQKLKLFYWGMAIVSTILLSIETDNISVMIFADSDNYFNILYDVRTFVYPVLWGLIAMGLMVWGIQSKEVILRKISLIFFALIIVKFYAYDVWHMSQAGRIVSFIMLGVIILLVSFLQQKIKTLVKEDVPENDQSINPQ